MCIIVTLISPSPDDLNIRMCPIDILKMYLRTKINQKLEHEEDKQTDRRERAYYHAAFAGGKMSLMFASTTLRACNASGLMASRINFYSYIAISLIRNSDITIRVAPDIISGPGPGRNPAKFSYPAGPAGCGRRI